MRMLDDLYWVMSYSRWKDENFWPQFSHAILTTHPSVTRAGMEAARELQFQALPLSGHRPLRARGRLCEGHRRAWGCGHLLPGEGCMFGATPSSIDAALYGFVANIFFYEMETPLKDFVLSRPKLVAHCRAIHAAVQPVGTTP